MPLSGRVLQTWVRGNCVFNLADPALMTESAVAVAATLDTKNSFNETTANIHAFGKMLRQI